MSFVLGPFEALEAGLWEHKPDVPDIPRVDLQATQLDTARGNLAALPTLEATGSQLNSFQRGQRAQNLASIPGLSNLEGLLNTNLDSWLRGQLPPDVTNAVATSAAGRALSGGYGGSGMATNLSARD